MEAQYLTIFGVLVDTGVPKQMFYSVKEYSNLAAATVAMNAFTNHVVAGATFSYTIWITPK